ncbi:MAG: double-strand break repair helicase AddA, partial [Alphaproteobacteria bacterium]|nr:double-strand break repair helicase AddA [Alphaproteobacteria bacterium]
RPGEEANRPVKPDLPEWARLRVPDAPVAARLSAPSRLLADKAPVSAPFGADRRAALQRGRLIHALLQNLPNLPLPVRADYARRFLQRAPDLSAADQMEMYEVTFQTLDHPDFAHIFAPGGRNEAAIVGTLPNGQMINGRVDRLIITPGRVEIIDYKTDRPAPKSADGVDLSYIVQMAAYRAVLQQLYSGETHQVNCTLLYTDGPVLIPLPDALLSESLNRLPT